MFAAYHQVDLESCPYLKDHPTAPHQYAEVDTVKREREDCIAVSYTDIDQIGYPVGTVLRIKKRDETNNPEAQE